MSDFYREETSQASHYQARIDRTTNWAVTVMTGFLTVVFSRPNVAACVLLIAIIAPCGFLLFGTRRYRFYDASRARTRLLQENLYANTFRPAGTEHTNWREGPSDDLRRPTLKISGASGSLSLPLAPRGSNRRPPPAFREVSSSVASPRSSSRRPRSRSGRPPGRQGASSTARGSATGRTGSRSSRARRLRLRPSSSAGQLPTRPDVEFVSLRASSTRTTAPCSYAIHAPSPRSGRSSAQSGFSPW